MKIDLELALFGMFFVLMGAMGIAQVAVAVGWIRAEPGIYASTHDDPSPGPNALF